MGAALEGAIAGVPSLAFSLILGEEARRAMKAGGAPSDADGRSEGVEWREWREGGEGG